MAVTVQDAGPSKKKLFIEVGVDEIKEELEKGYAELIQNMAIKGFRKGHAPRWLVEKKFSKEVTDDVKDKLKRKALADALEELKIEPMGEPLFENEEFEPEKKFTFDVTLEVKPDFEMQNYKNMPIDKVVSEISDEDVDKEIEYIRRRMAELEVVTDGAVEPGDVVTASVDIAVDGKSVWKNEQYVLPTEVKRLAGTDIEDLGKKLTGKKLSDTLTIDATLGDDFFQEEHRGKKARFTLTIKDIKRPKLPELNDEFAKKVGFDDLSTLRERLVEQLKRRNEDYANADMRNQIKEKLLEMAQFELPEDITKKLSDDIGRRRALEMQYYGVAESVIDKESEKIAATSRKQAERDIRMFLILEKIAAGEKIFVTETDIQGHIEELARSRGAAPRAVRQEVEKGNLMGELRMHLREEKVMDFILKDAKIAERTKDEAEKEKAQKAKAKKEPAGKKSKEDEPETEKPEENKE